jgi:hypothetical protein
MPAGVTRPACQGVCAEIARRLGLSTRAVDNHLGRAHDSLAVSSRAELRALHEPLTLPEEDLPPVEWTDFQWWFSTIPTMLSMAGRPAP